MNLVYLLPLLILPLHYAMAEDRNAPNFLRGAAPGQDNIYGVTCHNDHECGTVCGKYSKDMVAPTEGLFGTSCSCQSGGLKTKCHVLGKEVKVCADGKAPRCQTACGQQICIFKDGKTATGTILSACPAHHPQNTGQCCSHKSESWCTCIIRDTIDMNWKPYGDLGGKNGWISANWGACGSVLESLNIRINTERATELVQPFLHKKSEWCNDDMPSEERAEKVTSCYGKSESECGSQANDNCSFCTSTNDQAKSGCYHRSEAEVLQHVIGKAGIEGSFTCPAVAAVADVVQVQ